MRHVNSMFHIENERLIKTSNNEPVPEDEPIVILRGRDRLALPALLHYRTLAKQDGCTDWFMERLDPPIEEFIKFREEHWDRMKQPGVTKGK